jgi:hypothetical protein
VLGRGHWALVEPRRRATPLRRLPSRRPLTRTRSSLRDRNDKDPTSESSKTLGGAQHTWTEALALGKTPQGCEIRGIQKKPAGGWKPVNSKDSTRCGSSHHLNSQVPRPMIQNRSSRTARPPSRLLSMNTKWSGQHPRTCEAMPTNGGPSIAISP